MGRALTGTKAKALEGEMGVVGQGVVGEMGKGSCRALAFARLHVGVGHRVPIPVMGGAGQLVAGR